MSATASAALSLAVLAALALALGGAWLVLARRIYKQGVLMLVAAVVLMANVLIWTV